MSLPSQPQQPPTSPGKPHRDTSQAFWTMVVGFPAVFSVMRLWVEAGGELQTTLLLVGNVGAVNLIAALFTTATRLVTTGLVAVFALGAVLTVSAGRAAPGSRLRLRPPLFARWYQATPAWFVVAAFGVALGTWQIIYLPLLSVAAVAAFQEPLLRRLDLWWIRVAAVVAALGSYTWLVLPTVQQALRDRQSLAVLLFAAPPVLALLVTGPVPAAVARFAAPPIEIAVLGLLAVTAVPVMMTPVLPLTVTTVGADTDTPEDIRGHVITTNDINTTILQERGGVRYVRNDLIDEQVLCPTEEELPRYRLRVRDFHVEDSLLGALGRRVRPITPVNAICRITP